MTLHTIHFMRGINPDTIIGLQNCAMSAIQQGASALQIHISCEGGTTDQGFAAYHFLRSLPIPVTMHCIGNIESMGVMLFLAADKRLIVPHGKIKIHPMHWGFNTGTIDHDRLAEFVASLDFDAKRYTAIFQERTEGADKPVDVFSHLMGQAKLLGATEALTAGIATGITDAAIPATATKWWV